MHPCQTDYAIAGGLRMNNTALGDESLKMLSGGVQFIPVVVYDSEEVVRKACDVGQPAQRHVIEHRLRQPARLLEAAGFDGIEAGRKKQTQRIRVVLFEGPCIFIQQHLLRDVATAGRLHPQTPVDDGDAAHITPPLREQRERLFAVGDGAVRLTPAIRPRLRRAATMPRNAGRSSA